MSGSRVVENAPDLGARRGRCLHLLPDPGEAFGVVVRIIDARHAMPAEIGEAGPTARHRCRRDRSGIGGNARDPPAGQKGFRLRFEPARVARLACQSCLCSLAEHIEEAACDVRLVGQARRQLHQKHAQLAAEALDLPEKRVGKSFAIRETMLMGHGFRHLDGKAEVRRHGTRPTFIGLAAMRLVEGGVDLDDRKVPGIAFQM
ncbi:hypothetical protein A8146_12985 [Mesorhizobium loti]|nr:hypothetical protein A8146_12985 [Mesorhizobium loti]